MKNMWLRISLLGQAGGNEKSFIDAQVSFSELRLRMPADVLIELKKSILLFS